jgi:carbamoyl-phosphate synthase large subunit
MAGGEFNDTHASWIPSAVTGGDTEAGQPVETDGAGTTATVEDVEAETSSRTFKQVDTCAGEFRASTPYYYSAREPPTGRDSSEVQVDRDLESVVVIGGGPIRIGQGVEFDYCAVHAVRALREVGIDAHVVNNNPETVSTDYDTSDGLFFEPVTAEEVADIIEETGADGVMVQFGGQTSVNVGEPLEDELQRRELDCEILGTSVEAMDLAEDRDRFNALMDELGISQPEGGTATSKSEALDLAHEIGYPVLVRPSYVLGGRAMDVVYSDAELEEYIEEAVRVAPDKPILVDDFLADAVELDVDAVADGDDVLIGGIMEHVEAAGVHSGDSACMIPPRSLSQDVLERVREVTLDIARALDTVGLLNVQLAVRDGEVFVLEANPRSSRTVPFVSKATGVPIAKLAAKVMAGQSLEELQTHEQIPEHVSVKEVVLPFDRLPGSDPRLGPEMKSTGEVMGTARSFGKAYLKAQSATSKAIPTDGTAIVDLETLRGMSQKNEDITDVWDGAERHFDVHAKDDFEDLRGALRDGEVDVIFSRDRDILEVAVEEGITYFSTVPSSRAALEAIETDDEPLDVMALSERPTERRNWGE